MYDASAFVGIWPFLDTTGNTLERLVDSLTDAGIKGGAVSPIEAILHPEPMTANLRLLETVSPPESRFDLRPIPIINPSLPIWKEHLDDVLHAGGGRVRAIKILPNYHSYSLGDDGPQELAATLFEKNLTLCIQVRMFDERTHHPLMVVPPTSADEIVDFVAGFPELKILVCGPYVRELATYSDSPNVSAEMSFVESGRTLKEALSAMGPERLLIGTQAPLLYIAAGVARLWADELKDDDRAQMSEGNFKRLFG